VGLGRIVAIEKRGELAALFFGWPPAAAWAQGNFVDGGFRLRRVAVNIKGLGFWCWAAPGAECHHFNHPNMLVQAEHQNITDPQFGTGAALLGAVNAQTASADESRGQPTGLEKPRMPQPFISPH